MTNDIVNEQMLWQMNTPLLWHNFAQSLEGLFMHFKAQRKIFDFNVQVFRESNVAFVNFKISGMLPEKELCIDFSNDDVKITLRERIVDVFGF